MPTEVIFGCAAVVTVPAVVALDAVVALPTVPVTLAPAKLVKAAPFAEILSTVSVLVELSNVKLALAPRFPESLN